MVNRHLKLIQLTAILFAVATITELPKSGLMISPVLAQTTNSSARSTPLPASILPASVPQGAKIKISSSPSLTSLNESLQKYFETKYPGTSVEVTTVSSDEAIQSLLEGQTNLAAIGRPLTTPEKNKGLVLAPVDREKIAIIVGKSNPYPKNLTFSQFARVFRGEITDWSQLGGRAGKIRFVDRPESNDVRRAFSGYKVFEGQPFQTGATATQLSQDDTNEVIKALGRDGISYAPASQVLGLKTVRIVSMHNTLPDDPRYPYSHIRGYVYKQGQPIFAVAAAAPAPTTAVTPAPAATTTATAPVTTTDTGRGGFPWWLLGIPILGGALLLALRKGKGSEEIASPAAIAPRPIPPVAPPLEPIVAPEPIIAPPVEAIAPPVIVAPIEPIIAPPIEAIAPPVVVPPDEPSVVLPPVIPPILPIIAPVARDLPKGELIVKADWGNDDTEINDLPSFTNPLPEPVTAKIEAEGLWSYGAADGVHEFDKLVDGNGNLALAEKERLENHLRYTQLPPATLVILKNGELVASGKGPHKIPLAPGDKVSFVLNDEPHYYKDNTGELRVKWAIVDAQAEV